MNRVCRPVVCLCVWSILFRLPCVPRLWRHMRCQALRKARDFEVRKLLRKLNRTKEMSLQARGAAGRLSVRLA